MTLNVDEVDEGNKLPTFFLIINQKQKIMNVFDQEAKPIFLIGEPIKGLEEQEIMILRDNLNEMKKIYQEMMPDYHIVVYTCDKIDQVTFNILSANGKQSNV